MSTLPLDLYLPTINRTLDNMTLLYCQLPLFEIEGLSREKVPVFSNGLCPDTWSTFGTTLVFLVIYIVQLVISLIGIIWKRNNGYIAARDPVYMIMSNWSTLIYVLLGCLRFLIGRKIFPCALYTFSYFLFPPTMMMPITLRCTRAFFLYKLNLLKTKLFEDVPKKNDQEKILKETERNLVQPIHLTVSNSTGSEMNIDSNSSLMSTSSLKTGDETEDDFTNSTRISDPTQKKDFRLLKIYEFLSGRKILFIAYFIGFALSIGTWLLFGIIEEAIYSNDTNPEKKRLFLIEGGMLVFTVGCSVTITTVLIIAILCLILLVFEVSFLILLIISDRDTWNIKKETIVQMLFQLLTGILFIILSQLHDFDTMIDFMWPYVNIVFYYLLIDNFICAILPIIYAIRKDRKDNGLALHQQERKVEEKSDLERILSEKKTFDILLDFGRRSYCTESILCYRDIQDYKKLKKLATRKKFAMRIINSYLKKDSPYELNMPKIEHRGEELRNIVENCDVNGSGGDLSRDLFQSVQEHCLNDMKDVFERLKSSNKEIYQLVSSWKNNTKELQNVN